MAEEFKPPASIEEMYSKTTGNKFSGINRPTAGAREEKELVQGKAPYQLYSLATPNGQKVGIIFEELGLEYDAHVINIMKGDQFTSGYVDVNPNSKIPCMWDNSGEPLRIFESGSILLYLADKYGKFIPKDTRSRAECINWLMFQMGGQGPMSGQFGHFYKYAPRDKIAAIEYGASRYGMEVQRMLDVLDQRLAKVSYLAGEEYSIADMACYPWVQCIDYGYNAWEFLSVDKYKNVARWCKAIGDREAVKRGMTVCNFKGVAKPWLNNEGEAKDSLL